MKLQQFECAVVCGLMYSQRRHVTGQSPSSHDLLQLTQIVNMMQKTTTGVENIVQCYHMVATVLETNERLAKVVKKSIKPAKNGNIRGTCKHRLVAIFDHVTSTNYHVTLTN